jgi:hypothetical protein
VTRNIFIFLSAQRAYNFTEIISDRKMIADHEILRRAESNDSTRNMISFIQHLITTNGIRMNPRGYGYGGFLIKILFDGKNSISIATFIRNIYCLYLYQKFHAGKIGDISGILPSSLSYSIRYKSEKNTVCFNVKIPILFTLWEIYMN